MVDAAGASSWTYATSGGLASESGPWTSSAPSYQYNGALMLTNIAVSQPNASDWVQSLAYNAAKRLTLKTAVS